MNVRTVYHSPDHFEFDDHLIFQPIPTNLLADESLLSEGSRESAHRRTTSHEAVPDHRVRQNDHQLCLISYYPSLIKLRGFLTQCDGKASHEDAWEYLHVRQCYST